MCHGMSCHLMQPWLESQGAIESEDATDIMDSWLVKDIAEALREYRVLNFYPQTPSHFEFHKTSGNSS